jgi:hypothetical protein
MQPAWQLRSAWAWRCRQRKAKRSRGGVGRLGTAIGVGGEEARALGLTLALVLNPGVIAGGAEAVASIATGGSDLARARARSVAPLTLRRLARLPEHERACVARLQYRPTFVLCLASRPPGRKPPHALVTDGDVGWRRRAAARPSSPRRSRSMPAFCQGSAGCSDPAQRHCDLVDNHPECAREIEARMCQRSRRDRGAPYLDLRLDTLTS